MIHNFPLSNQMIIEMTKIQLPPMLSYEVHNICDTCTTNSRFESTLELHITTLPTVNNKYSISILFNNKLRSIIINSSKSLRKCKQISLTQSHSENVNKYL
uniref:Uncharacterized protein n=1 Tax=Cacopsylla melanoneura TaxID=428564 RepID=A0A8D9AAR3_9HEMI